VAHAGAEVQVGKRRGVGERPQAELGGRRAAVFADGEVGAAYRGADVDAVWFELIWATAPAPEALIELSRSPTVRLPKYRSCRSLPSFWIWRPAFWSRDVPPPPAVRRSAGSWETATGAPPLASVRSSRAVNGEPAAWLMAVTICCELLAPTRMWTVRLGETAGLPPRPASRDQTLRSRGRLPKHR